MFENREIFTSIRKQEFYILCRLILHALHSTLFFHINRARIFVHPFLLYTTLLSSYTPLRSPQTTF